MAKHKFASISLTVRDRAISSKFSTHRVSKECNICNFQKNFPPSPKMAAILNFRIFAKNGKTQICFYLPKTVRPFWAIFVEIFDPKFCRNRSGYLRKNSKIQNGRHFWGGENFWKIAKIAFHKFASISLTVRDRAISSKFSTHRVKFRRNRSISKECNLCNFQKIFPSPKMATILNFRIFAQNGKTQICFYLLGSKTVRDRAISSKFSTHRVSKECNLCNFPKIFPSPKMAAILNFRIFAKNGKTQICFYLLNRAR